MSMKSLFVFPMALTFGLLAGCGGDDDNDMDSGDNNSISHMINLSKSFSADAGYEDDIRTRIYSTSLSSANSLSLKLSMEAASSVTKAGTDSSVRLEGDTVMAYKDTAGNDIYVINKLRYDGTGFSGVSFIEKCFSGAGCEEYGVSTGTLNIAKGDEVNLTTAWSEPDQKFTFGIGSTTQEIFISDVVANQDFIDAGGINFADHTFSKMGIRGTIRNILNTGESGTLALKLNELSVDGAVYEDFSGTSLDTSKWTEDTYDF